MIARLVHWALELAQRANIILNNLQNKLVMSETKIILDACCGSRMFWFDKENPLTLFADIRDEEHTLCDGRSLKVHPDIVSDFTDMPFLDESFKLVVFDPPHLLKVGKNSWLAKKYGKLPEDWPRLIKKGVDECFRVLENYGVLIFKWNEDQITVREVLKAINRQPLFGHTTGRHGKTMWMCFMKLPINVKQNRMNIEEAIKAMQSGAKLTHKYLPAMGTQYLYIIDGEYVDSKGYILNKVDVETRLKANIFKIGWQKVY